jgi:hypothetical protein
MKKHKFTYAERYAVWHCHGRKCHVCTEPLRLDETTIDHFFPESLLTDEARRVEVLVEYGELTQGFDINGFENWLPCHGRWNKKKGKRTLRYTLSNLFVIETLIKQAPLVKTTALKVSSDVTKDELFGRLFAALEERRISTADLWELFTKLFEEPAPTPARDEIIMLDNGYWIYRKDVAREGECQCERDNCVDSTGKVHCYFRPNLSPWVIKAGLYWKCYDEIIRCPRCSGQHKRGHIGKDRICGNPYRNQESQTD